MFAGIIKNLGVIISTIKQPFGLSVCVRPLIINETSLLDHLSVDDSVAVNGVCLTATKIDHQNHFFWADIVHTTLEKSNLSQLKPDQKVHLELSIKASDRLGGHLVQGHVQSVGTVKDIVDKGGNFDVTIQIPSAEMKYLVNEGPIVIDGVSLTVAKVIENESSIIITIIPHTWNQTRFSEFTIGEKVNIETDLFAQYIHQYLDNLSLSKKIGTIL